MQQRRTKLEGVHTLAAVKRRCPDGRVFLNEYLVKEKLADSEETGGLGWHWAEKPLCHGVIFLTLAVQAVVAVSFALRHLTAFRFVVNAFERRFC